MNGLLHEPDRALETDISHEGEAAREGEAVSDDELLYDEAVPAVTRARRSEIVRRELVRAGDVLAGKYLVESVAPRGRGVVIVYAKHLELGQRVVVKFLPPEACTFPERVGRFLREARAAVRIQSEHVAKVTDVGRLRSGAPFMVIELPRGSDLVEVLRVRGSLTVAEAVDYLIQACEAVSEAHSLGVIHGNLSLANLILCRRSDDSPLIKVMGFGGSQSVILDAFSAEVLPGEDAGDLIRTLPYVAPEQIRNAAEADGRSDVWAFGAILHELLSGSPVYEAATVPALLAQIAADPPFSVTDWRPDVPLELDAVIQHCLAKDPAARYPSVGELVHALAPFASADSRTALERVTRIVARGPRSTPPPLPSSVPARSRQPPKSPAVPRRNSSLVHVGSNPPPAPAEPDRATRTLVPVVALALGLGGGIAFGAEYVARSGQTPRPEVAAPAPTPAPAPAPAPVAAEAAPVVGAAASPGLAPATPAAASPPATPAPAPIKPAEPRAAAAPKAAERVERPASKPKAEAAPETKPVAVRSKDLFDDLN